MTDTEIRQSLQQCAKALAGVCDGAVSHDEMGFNGPDASFGGLLASTDCATWDKGGVRIAWETLRKYKVQLSGFGIDFDKIAEPEVITRVQIGYGRKAEIAVRRIELAGQALVVRFPYDPNVVTAVKEIPGRRYNPVEKCWEVPIREPSIVVLREFATAWGFEIPETVEAGIAKGLVVGGTELQARPKRITFQDGMLAVNFEYDTKIVDLIRSLPRREWDSVKKTWMVPLVPESIRMLRGIAQQYGFEIEAKADEMMTDAIDRERTAKAVTSEMVAASFAATSDFEVAGLGGTLKPFQRAGVEYAFKAKRTFIADDMGLGKTVQALATTQALNAFPALVVCPATLKINWRKEATKWLPGKIIEVLNGRRMTLPQADITIINYENLGKHLDDLKNGNFKSIIVDESQLTKSPRAARSILCKEIAENIEIRLCLTGTPILNRPIEIANQLDILGRLESDFGGLRRFKRLYCGSNGKDGTNLDELNTKLRATCYIRRTKSEVLKELPPMQWSTVDIEIDNRAEYTKAQDDLIEWLLKNKGAEKADAAMRAEQLVKIETLKQIAVKGKMAAAKEWIGNFLDSGEKLIVFATHVEAQRELLEAFPGAAHVMGCDDVKEKDASVVRFQTDPECKLIVVALKAGGVGLTLTAASNVAFIEYGWNPAEMDQGASRAHRMGQEDSVTAYLLNGMNTIDDMITDLIERKRIIVNAATDGGAMGGDGSIMKDLIARLVA